MSPESKPTIINALRSSDIAVFIAKICTSPKTSQQILMHLKKIWSMSETTLASNLQMLEQNSVIVFLEKSGAWQTTDTAIIVLKRYFGYA